MYQRHARISFSARRAFTKNFADDFLQALCKVSFPDIMQPTRAALVKQ